LNQLTKNETNLLENITFKKLVNKSHCLKILRCYNIKQRI